MADEVVGKYVDAIGGKDAIAQMKSISMVTSAQVMGNDVPGTVVVVDGVGYKSADGVQRRIRSSSVIPPRADGR